MEAPLDPLVNLVQLVERAPLDTKVLLDKGKRDIPDPLERKDPLDLKVQLEMTEKLDPLDRQESEDLLARLAKMERMESPDPLEKQGPQEKRVKKVLQGPLENQAKME